MASSRCSLCTDASLSQNQTGKSLIYFSTKTAQTEAVRLVIWLKLTTFNKRIHWISEKQQRLHRKGTMRSNFTARIKRNATSSTNINLHASLDPCLFHTGRKCTSSLPRLPPRFDAISWLLVDVSACGGLQMRVSSCRKRTCCKNASAQKYGQRLKSPTWSAFRDLHRATPGSCCCSVEPLSTPLSLWWFKYFPMVTNKKLMWVLAKCTHQLYRTGVRLNYLLL